MEGLLSNSFDFLVSIWYCLFYCSRNIEPDAAYEVPSHIDLEPPEKLSWNLNYDLVDRIELAKDFIDS